MGRKQKVYLSLGSNLGNRHANLQKAIFRIQQKAGSILDISSVYENPAIGFEGDQFLNIVVSLLTPHTPDALLNILLQIEQDFGRIRSEDGGYSSRTLDIDIIYYGSEIVNNDDLMIPHPQMQHRNFVLKPLGDIAPQFYHPVLYKDTRNLLQECRDKSQLTKTKHKLFKDRSGLFSQLQLIAIEGNIGAGKTTLSKMISNDFNAKLVLERFADNPFLPKFYEDQARYAFPLEMSFLADRYQQFMDDTSQFDLFKNFMVSDYDIFKSLIFAKVTLQKEEYNLYRKVFNFMYKEVRKPEIYLYLYQNTERLLANIKKRGRDYEQNIDPEYLEKINRGYLDFIKSHPNQNSIILDMGELDFVHNPDDYEFILEKLEDNILLSNI
ncbi:2-amino-4-hydroxy-6-hydroxymethyldihydropteridine diphosphokinase [Flagellimonas lutimaris]|uniref:2-amino-4-hydroxy-6-hydroxymethyldihydropteridine pyrophosphokinase n=1 Tax=Flagellimonas lutimaris TaxID=475082 RepID=A0A3A1NBF9_9FLAO|nr:2-amino-4-hydroxy-6-hydroxymethyldihydropteridine diphosphokinase [Allomuricauda lutimaris]RIV38158.1 2-amino-4-hydroxy-6-hydroxymethyldihydropteridine diphosphokinase [Allomuricauda lutimaris]